MALKTTYKDAMYDGARKYRIAANPDGTSGIADATVYTQEGDPFGANDINEVNEAVNHLTDVEVPALKKSVSDGKALVAAAITAKRVVTAATATFAELAANIARIVLGSGNAGKADVLAGKTFTNDDGVEYAGTMPDRQSKHGSPGINPTYPNIPVHPMTSTQKSTATNGVLYYSGVPPVGYYSGPGSNNCYAGIAEAQIANMTGVAGNANKMLPSLTVAGVRGTIPDHTGKPTECTNARVNNNRFEVAVSSGYYGCSWDSGSYEYLTFARVASTLGVSGNAGKMLNTLTIAGVRGTIANRNSAFHGLDCGVNNYGLFYHVLPGYYQEGANNPWVYRTLPEVAAALGITANKIKKGEVVCGVTGTWNNYVAEEGYYYISGNECVSVTGGWAFSLAGGASTGSLTRGADRFALEGYANYSSTDYVGGAYIQTNNKIDVSKIRNVYVSIENYQRRGSNNTEHGIASLEGPSVPGLAATWEGNGTFRMDVSNVTGTRHLKIMARGSVDSESGKTCGCSFDITSVRYETMP